MDLQTLRLRSRQQADMVNDMFVTDEELTFYINQSLFELRDLLVTSYGNNYPLSTASLTISSGSDAVNLPTDAYKIMGVDILVQNPGPSTYMTLNEFNFNERNLFNGPNQIFGTVSNWWTNIRWRVRGRQLWVTPTPNQDITLKLWYVPELVELVADLDTVSPYDATAGWLQYVIVDAAIKMLVKKEFDVTVLMMQKASLRDRIIASATIQNIGNPKVISDVRRTGNNSIYTGRAPFGTNWGI